MKFTLTIELGNDAMQDSIDVAMRIRVVADRLIRLNHDFSVVTIGPVRDLNGNTVGRWEVTA